MRLLRSASNIYCPTTVPVTPCGRYVYHSHSHISLLGQLYSTIKDMRISSFVARNPGEGGRCVLPREVLYSCLEAFTQ